VITTVTSATVGALVRQARLAAGISQSELGQRIGASRFWVAQFEKGKPGAELGLALKAMHAVGLAVQIEPRDTSRGGAALERSTKSPATGLAQVIAHTTLSRAAPSSVTGWPSASTRSGRSRKP